MTSFIDSYLSRDWTGVFILRRLFEFIKLLVYACVMIYWLFSMIWSTRVGLDSCFDISFVFVFVFSISFGISWYYWLFCSIAGSSPKVNRSLLTPARSTLGGVFSYPTERLFFWVWMSERAPVLLGNYWLLSPNSEGEAMLKSAIPMILFSSSSIPESIVPWPL